MTLEPSTARPQPWLFRRRQTRSSPEGWMGLLSWLLLDLTLLYIIALLLLNIGLHFAPERNVSLAFFLYLPPLVWLLPLGILLPLNLLLCRTAALLCLFAALLHLWLGCGYRWNPSSRNDSGDVRLKVMTYNRGEQGRQGMGPFVEAQKPDLIALQEASLGEETMLPVYFPEYTHIRREGRFLLMSKFPILEVERVEAPFQARMILVGVRSLLDVHGMKVAIYNIHLPTPRKVLMRMRMGGFLLGLIGLPGTSLAERRHTLEHYWNDRVALSEIVARSVEQEPWPTLVVGDFNTPSRGLIYKRFCRTLTDSHSARGTGFGFTFPGNSRNPIALFKPWMRIDYIFADSRWEFLESIAEPNRPSQHRAVAATVAVRTANSSPR